MSTSKQTLTPVPVGARWLAVLLAFVLAAPLAPSAAEGSSSQGTLDLGDYRIVEGGAVYLGNPRLFTRPCVVLADSIYRQIPEYREILDKGLTDKDVHYHFLMRKASERFTEAVKQMARDLDHDLVAEVGACKSAKREVSGPPDRTSDVISRLK
jgi:hypothetical protein